MKLFSTGAAAIIVICIIASSAVSQPWNLRMVDNVNDPGYNSRIAVASDGTPYILYVQGPYMPYPVYLAWWVPSGPESGGWDRTSVGCGFTGYRATAMTVDANDNLHLSWSCGIGSVELYYAVFSASTKSWVIAPEVVQTGFCYPAIGIIDDGGTNEPVVAYQYNSDLYYATRDSIAGTWSSTPIYTQPGGVGNVVSMAVGSTGQIYICFYEQTDDDLMYATKASGDPSWATGYIHTTGNVGEHNSIVMDENDVPHVVYYDTNNGDLCYATLVTP